MGLLADFFVATEQDALRYDGERSLPESHRAHYTGFTEIELSTLYMIAQGLPVDAETVYDFQSVSSQDDGEEVTMVVLPELCSRLAAASDDKLKSWAALWGDTEELKGARAELLPVLVDLRRLSVLAASEGKSVFLWNCV